LNESQVKNEQNENHDKCILWTEKGH
jgi:hypothetical protein